jgi:ABC-type polysaccharide/polyol phosphate export permease
VVGVFIKDLATILANLLPILWFLSPGIYPAALVERRVPALMPLLTLNPLYYLLPSYESIFIANRVPPLGPLLVMIATCIPLLIGGFALFRRARYHYYSHL